MSDTLLPCPFCGCKAVFDEVTDEDSPDFGGHFVRCTRCLGSVGLQFANKEDPRPGLTEKWNRRAALSNTTNPSVLRELADRCEREEPSRGLDCAIGCAVGEVADDFDFALDYTTSLDAAVMLCPEGIEWNLTNLYGIAMADVGLNFSDGNWQTGRHKGGHVALALCAAALRARAALSKTKENPPTLAGGGQGE